MWQNDGVITGDSPRSLPRAETLAYLHVMSDFKQNWYAPTNTSKNHKLSNFTEIRTAVLKLIHAPDGRIDWQTWHDEAKRRIFGTLLQTRLETLWVATFGVRTSDLTITNYSITALLCLCSRNSSVHKQKRFPEKETAFKIIQRISHFTMTRWLSRISIF
jgi:hypothetical protein